MEKVAVTTITLTFAYHYDPNRSPSYDDTSHIIIKWLIRQAHAMLTKEQGNDTLIFIINGESVTFPQKINYTTQLANDVARLVEHYAIISVGIAP